MKLIRAAAVKAKLENFFENYWVPSDVKEELMTVIDEIPAINISNVVLKEQVNEMIDDIGKSIQKIVNEYLEDSIDD